MGKIYYRRTTERTSQKLGNEPGLLASPKVSSHTSGGPIRPSPIAPGLKLRDAGLESSRMLAGDRIAMVGSFLMRMYFPRVCLATARVDFDRLFGDEN